MDQDQDPRFEDVLGEPDQLVRANGDDMEVTQNFTCRKSKDGLAW